MLKRHSPRAYRASAYFEAEDRLVEAQRIHQRTQYDLEMMREIGYCTGIENYSRHLAARPPGSRPYTLIDYFSKEFITIIDESHVAIPQLRAMYKADQSRKATLVEHAFDYHLPWIIGLYSSKNSKR